MTTTKWQYKTLTIETKGVIRRGVVDLYEIETTLNNHGREGWELVSVTAIGDGSVGTSGLVYTFKRPDSSS